MFANLNRVARGNHRVAAISSEPGRELVDHAVEQHVANERRLLAPLSLVEQEQLAALLKRWLLENE